MKPCPDRFPVGLQPGRSPSLPPDLIRGDLIPAKAGTHRSAAPAAERWTPAFAGEAFNVVAPSPTALFLSGPPPARFIVCLGPRGWAKLRAWTRVDAKGCITVLRPSYARRQCSHHGYFAS